MDITTRTLRKSAYPIVQTRLMKKLEPSTFSLWKNKTILVNATHGPCLDEIWKAYTL